MVSHLRSVSLLLVCALVLPALAADDNKNNPDKKPVNKDKTEHKEKLKPAGQVIGKLMHVDTAQKKIKVHVTVTYVVPVRNGYQINLQRKEEHKDIEIQATDDVKVRLASPPVDYDEKGRPKRYTAKELKELRGPEKLWGYSGDFDSLKSDQIVRVFLGMKKAVRRPRSRDKDQDKDVLAENKPLATMIYILGEPKK